jgi:adenosylcobinamide kinase (EC 2.7.1.156)
MINFAASFIRKSKMEKKIILITGGQRSGKSQEAERLALSLTANPVYVATAHIWDEEFRVRVSKHQERTTVDEY